MRRVATLARTAAAPASKKKNFNAREESYFVAGGFFEPLKRGDLSDRSSLAIFRFSVSRFPFPVRSWLLAGAAPAALLLLLPVCCLYLYLKKGHDDEENLKFIFGKNEFPALTWQDIPKDSCFFMHVFTTQQHYFL